MDIEEKDPYYWIKLKKWKDRDAFEVHFGSIIKIVRECNPDGTTIYVVYHKYGSAKSEDDISKILCFDAWKNGKTQLDAPEYHYGKEEKIKELLSFLKHHKSRQDNIKIGYWQDTATLEHKVDAIGELLDLMHV